MARGVVHTMHGSWAAVERMANALRATPGGLEAGTVAMHSTPRAQFGGLVAAAVTDVGGTNVLTRPGDVDALLDLLDRGTSCRSLRRSSRSSSR